LLGSKGCYFQGLLKLLLSDQYTIFPVFEACYLLLKGSLTFIQKLKGYFCCFFYFCVGDLHLHLQKACSRGICGINTFKKKTACSCERQAA
jgi:hypothetical protein